MFAWDEAPTTRGNKKAAAERRLEMYRREIELRAALLHRLRFTAARAKARIKAQVGWDFELHGTPKHASEIDKVVDAVYRRGGTSTGAPSV
jgi:hypothetical protein